MSTILGNPITLGGGGLELVANVSNGATVTATLGSKTVTGVSSGGQARLKIPQEGKWTVAAAIGTTVSDQQEVIVPATVDFALPSPVQLSRYLTLAREKTIGQLVTAKKSL